MSARRATALLIAAAGALVASVANAKPCAPAGPWVLATVRTLPNGVDSAAVLDRLGVELAAQGITLCTEAPPAPKEPAAATVEVRAESKAARSVGLDVGARRGQAEKRAHRDVDLSVVPRDSKSVVVALAADELMRAAWDELALSSEPAPKPQSPPPAPTEPAATEPDRASQPLPRPDLALGARGAAEWWSGGVTWFGADAGIAAPIWDHKLRLELYLGGRAALEEEGPHGTVDARALSLRFGAVLPMLRRGLSPELALASRLGVHAVHMSGSPMAGAQGSDDTDAALTWEIGPSMTVALGRHGPLLVLDAGLAAALRGVAARDGGDTVTGMSGIGFTTSLGLFAGVL